MGIDLAAVIAWGIVLLVAAYAYAIGQANGYAAGADETMEDLSPLIDAAFRERDRALDALKAAARGRRED